MPALVLCLSSSFVVGCGGKGGSSSDAGSDAAACLDICDVNAHCDASGASPMCVCNSGYVGSGIACDPAPVCTPACGAHATCQTNFACACDAGYHGDPLAGCVNTPIDACQPRNPCLNGGTCTLDATKPQGYACTCVAGSSGANCEVPNTTVGTTSCGTYTDIVYSITASFEIRDTPFMAGDQKFMDLKDNATTPAFQDPGQATPFRRSPDPTPTFARGFVRLRYDNDAVGKPVAGTVHLVEYYVPLEFTQTKGATLAINTDHSVGLIDTSLTNCGGGDATCMNHKPGVMRSCAANAQGLLVGRTLTWDACTPTSGTTAWNYVMARAATGAGCATGYNAFGNATNVSGSPLVPAAGMRDSYQTWSQTLQGFVFDGTDPTTATFTMPAMQIPNGTGISTTWLAITSSTIVGTYCGTKPGADLVCNVQ